MATKGKILALISSGRGLPLKDGKIYTGAGYYLNEVTVPVRALMKEGYEITFANPTGNTPQVECPFRGRRFFRRGRGQAAGLHAIPRRLAWAQRSSSHQGCHRVGPGSI
jgi:hypothetical protein